MNDNERIEKEENKDLSQLLEDLVSARDAASILKVSEATVWRWIDQDVVPAYRMGNKRVFLRRSELESLIKPLRKGRKAKYVVEEDKITRFRMADAVNIDVLERARALQADLLAQRNGELLPESWEDINAARDQRTDSL